MKVGIDLRRVAWYTMKPGERDGPLTFGPSYLHHCIQGGESNTHIAGVDGDAFFTCAEDSVNAVVAHLCRTATTRRTFITFLVTRIVEVVATGSLQQIAAHGSHVPKLL